MNSRTKLALIQNTIIGVPVIIVISAFNGFTSGNPSLLVHTLGSALFGYTTSLIMLYITLKWFKVRSRFDQQRTEIPAPIQNSK